MPTPREQSDSESSSDSEATREEEIGDQGVARDERIVSRVPMWAWEEVGELPPFQPGYKPLSPAGATRELLELTRELIPVARLVGRVEEWASFAANLDLHVQADFWATKREAIEILTQAGWIQNPTASFFGDHRAPAGPSDVEELLDEMLRRQRVVASEMSWHAATPPSPTAEATTPKQDGRNTGAQAAMKICRALREYNRQDGPLDLTVAPFYGNLGGLHDWAGAIIGVSGRRAYAILKNAGVVKPGRKGQTRDKLEERFKAMIRFAEDGEDLKSEK